MRHLQVLRYIEKVARTGSLRRAAEELNITPSALNRRILAVEEELGVEIFERHPAGLRPNIAGEILLKYIRDQLAAMDQVRSRIADLSGMRAGHVNIAATGEVTAHFLPRLIAAHLEAFPAVTFGLSGRRRGEAEATLTDHASDIAVVFEPVRPRDLHTVCAVHQEMFCLMSADHPLAGRARVHIYDCADFPLLLPARPEGVREVLDAVAGKVGMTLEPAVETDGPALPAAMLRDSHSLGFAIAVALPPQPEEAGLKAVPLELQGVRPGVLTAGFLRGRTLPVAAARFLEEIDRELSRRFG